jgi:hypothetical protein
MKKIIFLFVCLLFFACPKANAEYFMTEALSTWFDYSVDDIIAVWGYPTEEKNVANKRLLIWTNNKTTYVPKNQNSYVYGNTINTYSTGGYYNSYYCNKTIEIDSKNIIIGHQWEGNNCPAFYSTGKYLVNPQNDPWEKARLEKIALKQKKKQEKLEFKKQKKEQKIKRKSEKNKNKKQKSGK